MDKSTYRIFVINPGSTSTKLALYEDDRKVFSENVFHDSKELLAFPTINSQLPYRMRVIRAFLRDNGIDLTGIDAIVGRGGSCAPLASGVYEANEKMLADTKAAVGRLNHVSNLGIQLACELQAEYGGRVFVVDPTVVDELCDLARVTGLAGVHRRAIAHALNLKETAKRHAAAVGRPYESLRLIVCHIDGGISVTAHENGRMIDGNNAAGGEGPFTPTRMGGMAVTDIIEHLSKKTPAELLQLCTEGGGFSSHFGTSNADEVHRRIESGDEYARLVWDAMIYQICKEIGAMAAVLCGRADGIVLAGGLLRFPEIEENIRRRCGFIAPVYAYPGEFEFEAMAGGALAVLRGETEPLVYTGEPVWKGFPFEPKREEPV